MSATGIEPTSRPDLTIVVVSYNTAEHTLACLRSIFDQTISQTFEVIVVDNGSSDESAELIQQRFPQVVLLKADENLGFAGANNLAARSALGKYLLLLNPDTIVLAGAIDKIVDFASHLREHAIVGGRTLYADRSLNPSSCHARPTLWSLFCAASGLMSVFRNTRLFDPESMGGWKRNSVRRVDIISGCFMLLPLRLWRRLGGFDPEFFMYGEDADLCLRAASLGATRMIRPDATIIHHGGASERIRADKMVRLFTAKVKLLERHGNPATRRIGAFALHTWALTRTLAFWVLSRFSPSRLESYRTWSEIFRRRGEWREQSPARPVPPASLQEAHS